jgi:hypothetical protein
MIAPCTLVLVHRIVLVMDRRRWAGQIVNLIDLDIERKGGVVADQFEMLMVERFEAPACPSEKVVEARHLRPLCD